MAKLNCKDFIFIYVTPTLEAPTKFLYSRIPLPFSRSDPTVMHLLPPDGNKKPRGGGVNTFPKHWVLTDKETSHLPTCVSLTHFTFYILKPRTLAFSSVIEELRRRPISQAAKNISTRHISRFSSFLFDPNPQSGTRSPFRHRSLLARNPSTKVNS